VLALHTAEAARWMATGKLHRKSVHFEVLERRSDKGEPPEKFKTSDIVDYLVRELEWLRDQLV
jgi:hypothetical protein